MPEEKNPDLKENYENSSEQVEQKTEQMFNLIRSHEERMKKTQDFLEKNISSFWKIEISKRVLSYQSKNVLDLFEEWSQSPEVIDLSDPEDKKVYYDILLLIKINNPQIENVSLDDMKKAFNDLKQTEWEKKYRTRSRDFKNKNPLSLKIPGKQYKHDWAYVVYPSFHEWWAAWFKMIEKWKNGESRIYKPHFSLTQVNAKYASNPGRAWEVAMNLWMPLSTKIRDIPTEKLVAAIAAVEDGECYKLWVDEGYIPSLPWVWKRKNYLKKK